MIALLLASERSGTHYLRSMLESSGLVIAPGEVCNAEAESAEHTGLSFFEFRAAQIRDKPELTLPTSDNQYELIKNYFTFIDNIRAKEEKDTLLMDIKYSHMHNFNCFWWDLFSSPFLIGYAKANDIPIIHLIRSNSYKTAFSEIYARASGVWRSESARGIVEVGVTVNVQELITRAQRIQQNIELVRQWLEGTRFIEVDYEAIVGATSVDAMNEIMEFLGLPRQSEFKSAFVKTTPPYARVISNYDEIRDFLA